MCGDFKTHVNLRKSKLSENSTLLLKMSITPSVRSYYVEINCFTRALISELEWVTGKYKIKSEIAVMSI